MCVYVCQCVSSKSVQLRARLLHSLPAFVAPNSISNGKHTVLVGRQ